MTQLKTDENEIMEKPQCFGYPRLWDGKVKANSACGKCAVLEYCYKIKATQLLLNKHPCLGQINASIPADDYLCIDCALRRRCEVASEENKHAGQIICPWCGSVTPVFTWIIKLDIERGKIFRHFHCLECSWDWDYRSFEGSEHENMDYVVYPLRKNRCPDFDNLRAANQSSGISSPYQIVGKCVECKKALGCLALYVEERKRNTPKIQSNCLYDFE